MSVFVAQLRKDLRVSGPILALWIGGLVALWALHSGPLSRLQSTITVYFGTLFELLPFLITALVVLQEPLGDSDAFWRTRPLSARALFGSKLTLIGLLVIAPALALQAWSFVRLELPAPSLAWVLKQTAWWMVTLVLFAWLLAAISRSLPVFVTWLVAGILLLNLGSVLILTPLRRRATWWWLDQGPYLTAAGIVLALFAVYWRYRSRRLGVFLMLAILAALLLRLGSGSHAVASGSGFALAKLGGNSASSQAADHVNVGALLEVPRSSSAVADLAFAEVKLEYPDGRVFEGEAQVERRYPGAVPEELPGLDADVAARFEPEYTLPTLVSISASELSRYAGKSGRLRVWVSGEWRPTGRLDVPARAGETWTDETGRFTVRALRIESGRLVLMIDELRIGGSSSGQIDPVLFNPLRREILRGGSSSSGRGDEASLRPLVISQPPSSRLRHELIQYFEPRSWDSRVSSDGYRFVSGPVDKAWLEEARIRLNASTAPERIEELITIQDFRLEDWL